AEVDFDVPVGMTGDCYDRLWVLVQRMWESCKIIEQCMEKLPAGEYIAPKLPKTLNLQGEIYVRTENPLGLMGYYLVGDGKRYPYRMKMRTASFSNVSVIPAMLPETLVPVPGPEVAGPGPRRRRVRGVHPGGGERDTLRPRRAAIGGGARVHAHGAAVTTRPVVHEDQVPSGIRGQGRPAVPEVRIAP